MAEKSAIQRIKELDSERANILAQAKEEALVKANQAIEELNALGFSYQLTNGAQKVKGKIAKITKDAPCPICEFQTSPPHDGRTHRNQGKKKKPFTPDELKARGLSRL
jgi:vacuolar-type H+-ATPase subunit H